MNEDNNDSLIEMEKIVIKNIGIDENNSLISEERKKEKGNLVKILDELKEKLEKEENKGIEDVYEEYYNNNEMSEREINNKRGKKCLFFNFYVLLSLSVIINLSGIFIIKSIINVVKNLLIYSIKSFFLDNNSDIQFSKDKDENFCYFYHSEYNFYRLFYEYSLNQNLDFNLIMVMDFLGQIILRYFGFKISSFIFLLINSISLSLIYNFDFSEYNETKRYTIFQLGYILGFFVILFIGVGCSALLSQHILIDSFIKYKRYKESNKNNDSINILTNENNNNNESLAGKHEKKIFDFFLMVCITTIAGKYFKYFLFIILIDLIGNKNENKNETNMNISYICTNKTIFNITQNNYDKDRRLFNLVAWIYIFLIILSILKIKRIITVYFKYLDIQFFAKIKL